MKKLKLFSFGAMAVALCVSVAFAACSKDTTPEENDNKDNASNTVVSEVFRNNKIQASEAVAKACDQGGTITPVTYSTRAYAVENYYNSLETADPENPVTIEITKTMYVYTPYGYDAAKKYNVLFLMHGGGENEGYWFGLGDKYQGPDAKDPMIQYAPAGNITKNVADNLIKDGTAEQMIIITATYDSPSTDEQYPNPSSEGGQTVQTAPFYYPFLWMEVKNEILPYIQSHYSTYAQTADDAGFKAARDHFGFIGFSMGSRCTYASIWDHCLDYFSYFGNLSEGADEEVLTSIISKLKTGEYKDLDIGFYYAACGEWDSLITTSKNTFDKITQGAPSLFLIGDNVAKGNNAWFNTHIEGGHEYGCWVADFYNCLQVFFK